MALAYPYPTYLIYMYHPAYVLGPGPPTTKPNCQALPLNIAPSIQNQPTTTTTTTTNVVVVVVHHHHIDDDDTTTTTAQKTWTDDR
jgi:hypothetical protein